MNKTLELEGRLQVLNGVQANPYISECLVTTEIYKSRWIAWNEINQFKEHRLSMRRRKLYGFIIKDINQFYSLIGFVQGFGASAFLVTDKLNDYQQFMQIAREKRPDLFEPLVG